MLRSLRKKKNMLNKPTRGEAFTYKSYTCYWLYRWTSNSKWCSSGRKYYKYCKLLQINFDANTLIYYLGTNLSRVLVSLVYNLILLLSFVPNWHIDLVAPKNEFRVSNPNLLFKESTLYQMQHFFSTYGFLFELIFTFFITRF